MIKSENINELLAALSKAQGEMKGAVKDSANPFFKNSYAGLESVWDACREALSKNNLAVLQTTGPGEKGEVVLYTTLGHSSGQYMSSAYPINPVKQDPQGIGSAITYARRYALAAIVGVHQTDDDGNAASGRQKQPEINNVQQKLQQQQLSKQTTDAGKGPHEHTWLPSHFKKDEVWCSICKEKRLANEV